jgi:hypothetical protein
VERDADLLGGPEAAERLYAKRDHAAAQIANTNAGLDPRVAAHLVVAKCESPPKRGRPGGTRSVELTELEPNKRNVAIATRAVRRR